MSQYPAFKAITRDSRYEAVMRRVGVPPVVSARSSYLTTITSCCLTG